jgi:hypothetical protein
MIAKHQATDLINWESAKTENFWPGPMSEHHMITQITLSKFNHFFCISAFTISFIYIKGIMMVFNKLHVTTSNNIGIR